MKKKITVFLSIIMACMMACSLTACKDKTGGGGGLPITLEKAVEKVRDMPTSTDGGAIEGAIGEVFGADIDLPEGTYSAQSITVNNASAYLVTVSGANTTASDYYNSIKSKMLAKGYIAEESELAFYKVVGAVVYSVMVEADGNDIIISMGATSLTATPGGKIPGGTTPGGQTGGETTAWPASQIQSILGYALPQFTGQAESFAVTPYTEGGVVGVSITITGTNADDIEAYIGNVGVFRDNGYSSAGSNIWAKRLDNGDNLVIPNYMQGDYDDNFRPTTLTFIAYIESNTGIYSSWPTTQIAANFSLAGIPTFQGGTSYDFTDTASSYDDFAAAYESIIQAYQIAKQYGVVDAELEAQYQEALTLIEEAEKVRAGRITVYETNETERQAYINKILSSPDDAYEDNFVLTGNDEYSRLYMYYTTEYKISITLSDVEDGKLYIDLLRVPTSLLEDDDLPVATTAYTMPENVKIVYDDDIYQYVIYKIGENYYVGKKYLPDSALGSYSSEMIEQKYYKKNGNVWDIYTMEIGDSNWVKDTDWQENDKYYLERDVFDFIVDIDDVEDAVETGTQTVVGKNCTIYELDLGYYKTVYYVDEESKLIFKSEIYYDTTLGYTYEITEFNTTVTSFEDVELP